jgi:hypothetical protein
VDLARPRFQLGTQVTVKLANGEFTHGTVLSLQSGCDPNAATTTPIWLYDVGYYDPRVGGGMEVRAARTPEYKLEFANAIDALSELGSE